MSVFNKPETKTASNYQRQYICLLFLYNLALLDDLSILNGDRDVDFYKLARVGDLQNLTIAAAGHKKKKIALAQARDIYPWELHTYILRTVYRYHKPLKVCTGVKTGASQVSILNR